MIFRDPVTNDAVRIDSEGKIKTDSVIKSQLGHASFNNEDAYILPFTQAGAAGALDNILYIKNNSDTPLVLSHLWLSGTAADEVLFYYGMIGTAAGGTAPVPVNLNTGSAKAADVTCHQFTDITGLSGGTLMFRAYITAAAISQRIDFDEAFILQKNVSWTMVVKTAQAQTLSGNLIFFF